MSPAGQARLNLAASAVAIAMLGAAAQAQQAPYPKPTELPNPYRLVEGWPALPQNMNGGRWGEVIRVHVDTNGNIWVFHRCFNTVPPGHATCIGRGDSNPPILEFNPSGKLLKSLGVGLFAYPHGFTIDGHGNLWVSDVNDEATVLGMSARNAGGVLMGQEVLKLSPAGKVLMTIGKEGVAGNGPDAFDRPTGVAVAPNGDVFVADGHSPNQHNSARVVKFSKDGRFIKAWGQKGAAPGDFDEPHDIFIGGSEGHVYVADRRNNRIQVFDQDGNFIAAWKQFGQPSSVFVGKDDTIYVGSSFPDPAAKKGELRGIVVGNAKDGSLKAFIPDPADPDKLDVGTSASGIAADDAGTIYAADVAAHNLRKYVKVSSAQAAPRQPRSLPVFEVDRAWPKVPAKWKLGDASSIAIDRQDNVWVLHRPRTLKPEEAAMAAPPVIVFDTAGNYIKAWGGPAAGYEWPEREHGIHIDYKGFVWLGGNNCPTNGLPGLKPVADDQLLKFTEDGKFVMQIGHSNQSKGNADTRNLHRPADVWVYPQTNELFVADGYGNHRVAVFDADSGAFKRMWGAFGNQPMDDDHCQIVAQPGFSDPGPGQLSIVHAIRVARDGIVYVADREYRRVQMFTKDGKFQKQLVRTDIPFARDLALSPDAGQQFLYVGGGDGIFVVDRKTLEIVGNIQPAGIIGPGHQIAVDSKGNLYIAQTSAGLQKLTLKGMSPASR